MISKLQNNIAHTLIPLGLAGMAALCGCAATHTGQVTTAASATTGQATFQTPEDAIQALNELAGSGDAKRAAEIFGASGAELIHSGDDVADRHDALEVKRLIQEKGTFEDRDDQTKIAVFGDEAWPFPIPLVKEPGGWRFDTAAGVEEIENRHIGRNELSVLATLHAFVDAQKEYFMGRHDGRSHVYAKRVISSKGKQDGLYWPTDEDQPASPLGPFIADATEEGYSTNNTEPKPYHGYYYHLLMAQGPNASGDAKSYLDDKGAMTKGFAMIAWPAEYGKSGVMTFVVDEHGLVFQKDLGTETSTAAAAITAFDPDESWEPTGD